MDARRFYREGIKSENLVFFQAVVEQTDLYIGAKHHLEREAVQGIAKYREELIRYIQKDSRFLHSLIPIKPLKGAPLIVMDMCRASALANVGPMAAVAGAFSKFVGQELLAFSDEIIVENGGDIFISSLTDRKIGIYAGQSPLSNRLAIKLPCSMTPCGICTSSGTVGHSLSFGRADAAVVLNQDASVADACATALGNRVNQPEDIKKALETISLVPGFIGALVIMGETLGAMGEIELCEH